MDSLQISNSNYLDELDEYSFSESDFELRMPSHYHLMYLDHAETDLLNDEIAKFIDRASQLQYEWHRWLDEYHHQLVYEFSKDE